ncbi:hypothetical protein OPT61_g1561 [Boeremia exigua]|uniref:Uncharacterized protein n=1 Tax=Boeremia exigua TaxID=749465 RepID=A0ACC2IPV3_9PLEO|nr:hypothetical protein OPT61_g1561 [Boeremia exigua]
MRSSKFYLLAPLLAGAADVKMVGLGYRGGEAVQAGQDITLTITNATEAGIGYPGRKATHFRITIWNSIYIWNMCSLTGILPAEDGNLTVTIPPDMGPSGMYYEIGAEGYENPTNESWTNIIMGKKTPFIYLAGGKGSWVPAEITPELKYLGLVGSENADIPCNSYPCAQQCAAGYFPLISGWQKGSDWMECLTACKGVTINTDNDERQSSVGIAVNSTLATPTHACKEADLETTCGDECCSDMEYCLSYKQCVVLPLNWRDRPTSTSASETVTRTSAASAGTVSSTSATRSNTASAQATGASYVLGVNWDLIGAAAAAGVFGIVGADKGMNILISSLIKKTAIVSALSADELLNTCDMGWIPRHQPNAF